MARARRQTAGAFDIRMVIGALFLVYGVILTVMGASASRAVIAKSANVNINLYTGIAMLVFAMLFAVWARLRPIEVRRSPSGAGDAGG